MYILSGFNDIQETHPWHTVSIQSKDINLSKGCILIVNDESKHLNQKSFLFLAPIFGGWKKYSVFKVDDLPFYIGWSSFSENKIVNSVVDLLRINENQIKLLNGVSGIKLFIFAVNKYGVQINLVKVGEGKIRDRAYKLIRLF